PREAVPLCSSLIFVRLLCHAHDAELTLPLHGVNAGDLLAHRAEPSVALQLTGGGLEAEVEQLDLRLRQLPVELFLCRGPQIRCGQGLSHHASVTSGLTKLAPDEHSIGSLCVVAITPPSLLA